MKYTLVSAVFLISSVGFPLPNAFASQEIISGRSDIVDMFEAGREVSVTTGNFCSADKPKFEGRSGGADERGYYLILNDFERTGSPIPNITLTVVKNETGAKLVFHAINPPSEVGGLLGAFNPFLASLSRCEEFDKLWTQKLILREVTAIAFDGVDIVSDPNGPSFQLRKRSNP